MHDAEALAIVLELALQQLRARSPDGIVPMSTMDAIDRVREMQAEEQEDKDSNH